MVLVTEMVTYLFNCMCIVRGQTSPPGNREISWWAPASGSVSDPQLYTRIYFIFNQLRQMDTD